MINGAYAYVKLKNFVFGAWGVNSVIEHLNYMCIHVYREGYKLNTQS